jgi:signal transduction histidine kinase
MAQRTLLQQCFSNLFDNALKFATPGERPCIILRSEVRPAATASPRFLTGAAFHPSTTGASPGPGPRRRIWVEDNGIGVPPEAADKIFGIFERIPGPAPVEGTGIGLAIVARATEQMGGSCGVESAPGRGSRFWIECAMAEPPAADESK